MYSQSWASDLHSELKDAICERITCYTDWGISSSASYLTMPYYVLHSRAEPT